MWSVGKGWIVQSSPEVANSNSCSAGASSRSCWATQQGNPKKDDDKVGPGMDPLTAVARHSRVQDLAGGGARASDATGDDTHDRSRHACVLKLPHEPRGMRRQGCRARAFTTSAMATDHARGATRASPSAAKSAAAGLAVPVTIRDDRDRRVVLSTPGTGHQLFAALAKPTMLNGNQCA